ncbi:MAG: hypothetical protein UT24_C0003G0012 [Candidatus Woesebacteria bacterium GW2011_GWB1_39_12]|uniref:Uncharacterized protein n=1 Tax=Candidatus Woesebacteria bacterium GW2011_GWB1_39_12 TaxID=1618574 RepID=A0A0G0PTV6_9BACT|nr:MAG: hypothetical protein UT24_C0003G0012 [Candidatus Woesebacteria bacterium GW2011_GWB1_39_12]
MSNGHVFMRCPVCHTLIEKTDRNGYIDFRKSPHTIKAVCPEHTLEFHRLMPDWTPKTERAVLELEAQYKR